MHIVYSDLIGILEDVHLVQSNTLTNSLAEHDSVGNTSLPHGI